MIDEITETTFKVLRDEKENTRLLVENVLEYEQSYVFTNDTEYMTQRTAIIPVCLLIMPNTYVDFNYRLAKTTSNSMLTPKRSSLRK